MRMRGQAAAVRIAEDLAAEMLHCSIAGREVFSPCADFRTRSAVMAIQTTFLYPTARYLIA